MRRTKEAAAQTRLDILASALKLFDKKGFEATSISEIARRAKVTRGAIYWHFNNKADIFIAIGQCHLQDMKIETESAANSCSPLQALSDSLNNFIISLEQDSKKRKFCALMQRTIHKQHAQGVDALYQHYNSLWFEQAASIIKQAKICNEIPTTVDDDYANLLIRSMISGLMQAYFDPLESIDVSKHSRAIIDNTLSILKGD